MPNQSPRRCYSPAYRCLRLVVAPLLLILLVIPAAVRAQDESLHMRAPEVQLEFPVDQLWVEVPFRLEVNKIIVPLSISGSEPLDFVLDTGATNAALFDGEAADGLELEVFGQAMLAGAGGSGDMVAGDMVRGVDFGLGALRLSGGTMAVFRNHGPRGLRRWKGIIGREIFDSLVVEVDWQAQRLRFADPARFQPPADAQLMALEHGNGHVYVQAELALTDGPPRSVRLMVDSGAFYALALDGRRFDEPPRPRIEGAKLGRGLGGVIRGGIDRVRELRLGGIVLRDVVTRFPQPEVADVLTGQSDGNLGADILRRFVVTFDYSRGQMWLRPTADVAEPFRFSTAGFAVRPYFTDEGTALVDDVYPASPALRADLQEGDEILRVDGRTASDIGSTGLRALLEQDPGTVLTLEVRRGEAVRTVELKLQRLL